MRFLFQLVILLLGLTSLVLAESPECKHDASNFRCVKYLKNYDADTITFNIPGVHPFIGEKISIRVKGIDTPELRTKDQCEKSLAKEGKGFVAGLMKNARRVDLLNIERGKYFRIVADVSVDGKLLSDEIRKHRLGYPYNGGGKRNIDWCNFRK